MVPLKAEMTENLRPSACNRSPWGTWLGANAIEAAIRAKRVTIWKVFMVMLFVVVGLLLFVHESEVDRAAPWSKRGKYVEDPSYKLYVKLKATAERSALSGGQLPGVFQNAISPPETAAK